MIKYIKSNVFNTNAEAIVNTINCEGVMGKGIALEFSLRYPNLLKEYKEKCANNEITIGKMFYYKTIDKLIVNFPTKEKFSLPSEYEWIEKGLINFIETYKEYNIKSIAFPPIGCGNGKLNFKIIKSMMEKYLSNLDLEIYICFDPKYAEGKELEMIELFNLATFNEIYNVTKNKEQTKLLLTYQNKIHRFNELNKIDSIGKKTYQNLFQHFYNNNNKFIQEKLF